MQPGRKSFIDPFRLRDGPQGMPEIMPGPGPLMVIGVMSVILCAGIQQTNQVKLVGISVGRMPTLGQGVGTGPTGVGNKNISTGDMSIAGIGP
jgi:hypothetical protein